MIDWVDDELVKWAKYFRGGCNELGYPSSTVESRMCEGGFSNDNKGCKAPDPYVPDDVAVMEVVLNKLFSECSEFKSLIKVTYLTGESTREDQAKLLARELRRPISRTRISEMLSFAHVRISGFYSGLEIFDKKSVDMSGH